MPASLTVVIPIHNEGSFLPTAIPELTAEMDALGIEWRLLLVENGSTDWTADVARKHIDEWGGHGAVLELATPDYGGALRAGISSVHDGDWIAMFDIDYFSGPFVAAAIRQDADIVVASKRAAGSDDQRSIVRRLGTWGFNLLLRTLFRSGLGDTHGMKVFRREAIAPLVPQVRSNQDLFDTELLLRGERAGLSIQELPVVVVERREARSSFVKRIPRTLKGLWKLRKILN